MVVIIDTREQLPLGFKPCVVRKLNVGDYSTIALEKSFAIERKSPADLYGTLIQGHIRFRKEVIRARVHKIKLVVFVECSRDEFINKQFYGGNYLQCKPVTLHRIIETFSDRYKLEFVWCAYREDLHRLLLSRLQHEERKAKGGVTGHGHHPRR